MALDERRAIRGAEFVELLEVNPVLAPRRLVVDRTHCAGEGALGLMVQGFWILASGFWFRAIKKMTAVRTRITTPRNV